MPEDLLDNCRQALLARLAELGKRHTQSEIARKIGTARNNVRRYIQGTRVPGEVLSALVDRLGVNPAWLLTGEGAPYLTDVAADTSRVAGDLLDLIKAMTAVADMKLGSLAGKHHLRVLRELNDALRDFEGLRERLNKSTAPIMAEMLDRYENAINKREVVQADDLRGALRQLSRLCPDDALSEQFLRLQARHELYYGNSNASIEMQQQIFRSVFNRSRGFTDDLCHEAVELSQALRFSGHAREAAAIARSVLALRHDDEESESVHRLQCALASAELWMGQIDKALPRFMRHYHQLSPELKQTVYGTAILMLLLSGTVSFEAMLQASKDVGAASSTPLLVYALWLEDKAALDKTCAMFPGFVKGPGEQRFIGRYAMQVREILHGRGGDWRRFHEEEVRVRWAKDEGDMTALLGTVALVQLPRLAGDTAMALRELKHAIQRVEAIPADLSPGMLNLAGHYKNVLKLVPQDAQDKALRAAQDSALQFLRDTRRHGFGGLQPLFAFLPSEASA